jgi:hypothetical protein
VLHLACTGRSSQSSSWCCSCTSQPLTAAMRPSCSATCSEQ